MTGEPPSKLDGGVSGPVHKGRWISWERLRLLANRAVLVQRNSLISSVSQSEAEQQSRFILARMADGQPRKKSMACIDWKEMSAARHRRTCHLKPTFSMSYSSGMPAIVRLVASRDMVGLHCGTSHLVVWLPIARQRHA
ncbi:hypothetical protein QR685DRAFT_598318 [Neurospora intermedia]|uniref:Uncharacterized protein n=1 Tax=Neurospora intermedia TaxID=5142 RepID=A0ABR3DBD3_NEUIN